VQILQSGRLAAQRRSWDEAWNSLSEADQEEPLAPGDLELLADAAWWAGRPDDSVRALERAYAGYVDAGQPVEAATVAALLAYLAFRRLSMSAAAGWKARAEHLLDGVEEGPAHALLKLFDLVEEIHGKRDFRAAVGVADETIELARRTGNRDVEAQALVFKGYALVAIGEWREGRALVDEASAVALSGGLSLRSASDVYCTTISACRDLADYRRAEEWTEEADRWMAAQTLGGYPGVCRVHRAELKRLAGAWSEAEELARDACVELERYRLFDGVGLAHYEIGEIRLLMGDLDGAEESFQKAFEFGFPPQPGLAMLQFARGKPDEAARILAQSLSDGEAGGSRTDLLARAQILPAQVTVALALGNLDTADSAADELDEIAGTFDSQAFEASAITARGEVALARGEIEEATTRLDAASRAWRDLGFPYESAKARILLGRARLAAGDDDIARMEFSAARSTFDRLGARADLRLVDQLLFALNPSTEDRGRVTKAFMFTDVVDSTDLVELIGDDKWEALLSWHDRELAEVFASHSGIVVKHTGDGFFVAFDEVSDAIDAAVAIQRRLVLHRKTNGFAPSVRIGIHRATAGVEGSDYRGQGVHLASRVAAVAGGEEIVVSADSLDPDAPSRFPIDAGRLADLKGIKDPVRVRYVDWR
jgi:class 3 adenylate cyclase